MRFYDSRRLRKWAGNHGKIDKERIFCDSVKSFRRYIFLMRQRSKEKISFAHSVDLPPQKAGELLCLPREKADWEWMSFFVRRLQPGDVYRTSTEGEEAAFVILGGTCAADWGQGVVPLGKRKTVFDGLPYTRYLPATGEVAVQA